MNSQKNEIWDKTLDIIKVELTEVSFNTWLKSITPLMIKDNTILLHVPDDFTKGIIETRYATLIKML